MRIGSRGELSVSLSSMPNAPCPKHTIAEQLGEGFKAIKNKPAKAAVDS